MIKDFCLAWEKNKDKLEKYFKSNKQNMYSDYKDLVKLLFDIVINPEIKDDYSKYNTKSIQIIDDGGYWGTLIFILHRDTCEPYINDYVYTNSCYGSCTYCDTLADIHKYEYDTLPNEQQIRDYMSLCLHLLQRCNLMLDTVNEE